jgi:hypothetical protein
MTKMPEVKKRGTWEELGLEPKEVILARLAAIRARKAAEAEAAKEAAKPKIVAAVSEKMAEAIKHDPTSVRISAKAEDDTPVIERVRPTEVIQLMDEPTINGKLARASRFDCATGETTVIEFVNGYRQPSGAVHVYDPFAALKGNDDD